MESQGLPSLSDADPAHLELDRHADSQQFDENDELLLLSMAKIGDDPVSPRLKAVIDKGNELDLIEPQKYSTTPLVMERPKSSGLNLTDFCFTKPLQYGKNFPFLTSTKQPSSNSALRSDTQPQKVHTVTTPNTQRKVAHTE